MSWLPPDYKIQKTYPSYDYKPKVLELIAQTLGDEFSGSVMVSLLKSAGVPDSAIEYPNTKWRTILGTFGYAKNEQNDSGITVERIIEEFLDPLSHNANEEKAKTLVEKIRTILKYDDLIIIQDGRRYLVCDEEGYNNYREAGHQEQWEEYESKQRREAEMQKKKAQDREKDKEVLVANREKILVIREHHQAYMDLLEIFCNNPSRPTNDLNSPYIFLKKHLQKLIDELHLNETKVIYAPFKVDLYSAEKEWGQDAIKGLISWDKIRPELYSVHSWITQRCNYAEKQGQQSDDEKKLGEINEIIGKYRAQKPPVQQEATRMEMKILHKYELGGDRKVDLYITKDGDDFSYKGRYVNLSKKTDYYKVFSALYAKLPNGGEVSYKDLIVEVKSRLPKQSKMQNKTVDEVKKFIQRNLTDKTNGFMRYAGIPETEDNGKPLIEVVRGSGVMFNNKAG